MQDNHDKPEAYVSTYEVRSDRGKRVAKISFKYPLDGSGRLFADVHWFGAEMVRGTTTDGSYETALADAARQMTKAVEAYWFVRALAGNISWMRRLADVGFMVE